MAMKKCRECGHKVSSEAKTCPSCGIGKPVRSNAGGIAVVALLALSGIVYAIPDAEPAPSAQPATRAAPSTAAAPTVPPSPACEGVTGTLLTNLSEGLTVTGGGRVSRATAVKSGAHAEAYFVAGIIEGSGLDHTVAVWATNRLDGSGVIFSVDAFAKEFSVWPDGGRSAAGFSMSDPGASEARACLR